MTRKKKLKITDESVELRYSNWMAQCMAIMMPWSLIWVAGRASAKTVQVLSERVQCAVKDCPGAPFVWVSDTYSDLHKNIIPSLIDGLSLLGWDYGTHYVINEEPHEEWRQRMYNKYADWKQTMTFYTGFNFTFVSLDRLSIGAGRSYVGLFGDEVKYFPEEKYSNLLKAVRGFYARYGNSEWYRSRTLTTDMPNPNHLGEYDWVLKYAKQNNKEKIMLLLKVGFVYNDCKKTYAAHKQKYEQLRVLYRSDSSLSEQVDKEARAMANAEKNMERWRLRWIKARKGVSLFLISSTYVNADVLGMEWFADELAEGMEGLQCNVLSIIPKLEATVLFYPNLTMKHFYADGYLNDVISRQPFGWREDCSVLKYLDTSIPIEGGMDSGNMLSMVFGQRKMTEYRVLKELYTLPPDTPRELADAFLHYFAPHKRKILKLYYDRSMNNYKRVNADMASIMKKNIERYADGRSTGWQVQLMSIGQGNIGSNMELRFMADLLSGNMQRNLFTLSIDQYNCKNLKSEMEVTKTKTVTNKDGASMVVKEKTGDKLPVARLARESTNLTDALKYLLMRKEWIRTWSARSSVSAALH